MLLHTSTMHTAHQSGTAVMLPSQPMRPRRATRSAHICKAIQSPEEVKTGKASDNGKVYPNYESAKDDEGLFNLPVREPGSFPEPSVHTPQDAPRSFLESISVDFSENASLDEDAFDPLRDGPLRFLGYSNEVGEAFAAWLPPGGVPASYALAISYVLVDTYDKGVKAYRRAKRELDTRTDLEASFDKEGLARLISTERALDTVIWQLIASVAAPGYTIHTIVALTLAALTSLESLEGVQQSLQAAAIPLSMDAATLTQLVNKSLPTAVGLAAIPFIVHPIDNTVHAVMNATIRPAMRKYVCERGGTLAGLAVCTDEGCDADNKGGH